MTRRLNKEPGIWSRKTDGPRDFLFLAITFWVMFGLAYLADMPDTMEWLRAYAGFCSIFCATSLICNIMCRRRAAREDDDAW